MKCDGCGNPHAHQVRLRDGIERCNACADLPVASFPDLTKRIPFPEEYCKQLGCKITADNKSHLEKKFGVKIKNQPFQESLKEGERNAEYRAKGKKEAGKERVKKIRKNYMKEISEL